MTWWGDQFVNLGELLPQARRPLDPRMEAAATRAALASVLAPGGALARGGVLYLPPWGAGSTTARERAWVVDVTAGRLAIPAQVSVVIAAGAHVLPLSWSTGADAEVEQETLDLEGEFEAPLAPVFGTARLRSLWRPGLPARGVRLGRVRLVGPRLRRVHVEWWGGGDRGEDAERDTQALAAAIEAALEDRGDGEVPVVQITRGLTLARAVSIGTTRPTSAALTLRGTRASVGPTLRAVASPTGGPSPQLDALLEADGSLSLVLEDVTLDGGGTTSSCVELGVSGGVRHRVARSELRGALNHLVSVLPGRREITSARGAGRSVVVEGCVMRPLRGLDFATDSAIHVARGTQGEVSVHGCVLVGKARAMIDAHGEALRVSHCEFENAAWPQTERLDVWPWSEAMAPDALHARMPEGGVDVYLGEGAGTLAMTGCGSTSVQLVVARGGGGASVSLVSVRHVPWASDYPAAKPGAPNARELPRDDRPASVDLGVGSGLAGGLSLAGCVFHRRGGDATPAVVVRDGNCRIVELGAWLLAPDGGTGSLALSRRPQSLLETVSVPTRPLS